MLANHCTLYYMNVGEALVSLRRRQGEDQLQIVIGHLRRISSLEPQTRQSLSSTAVTDGGVG